VLIASLEKLGVFWEKVNFVIDCNEHQAQGSKRQKLTFALTESCLLVLCATVVIAATRAHVGLLTDNRYGF
jgi:hypothetical protein